MDSKFMRWTQFKLLLKCQTDINWHFLIESQTQNKKEWKKSARFARTFSSRASQNNIRTSAFKEMVLIKIKTVRFSKK